MPTSSHEHSEFAEDFREIGFICRVDVGIDPYAQWRNADRGIEPYASFEYCKEKSRGTAILRFLSILFFCYFPVA